MKKRNWFIVLAGVVLLINTAYACQAALIREYAHGTQRICIYSHLGKEVPMAVYEGSMCPISIFVPHQ